MGIGPGDDKVGLDGSHALDEEGHRRSLRNFLVVGKMWKLVEVRNCQGEYEESILTTNAQYGTTGDHHFQLRAGLQQFDQEWSCHRHLLEIVQEEQLLFVSQVCFEVLQGRLICRHLEPQYLRDGGSDYIGITDVGKRDEVDAIVKVI